MDKCDGKLGPSIVRISDAKIQQIPGEVEQKVVTDAEGVGERVTSTLVCHTSATLRNTSLVQQDSIMDAYINNNNGFFILLVGGMASDVRQQNTFQQHTQHKVALIGCFFGIGDI